MAANGNRLLLSVVRSAQQFRPISGAVQSSESRDPIFLALPANPWDDTFGQVANEKNPARDGRQAGRRSQGNA